MEPIDTLGQPSGQEKSARSRIAGVARTIRTYCLRPPRAFLWSVSVAGAALIGLVVNEWWSAPRVHFELSALQLRSVTTGDDQRVPIPLATRTRISQQLYLTALKEKVTVKEVREYIVDINELAARHQHALERLDKLIDLVRTTPTTTSVEQRRRQLLEVWFADSQGQALVPVVKQVIAQQEDRLPKLYLTPRRDAGNAFLEVTPTVTVAFSEIDELEQARSESAVRGRVNVYDHVLRDARKVNILRRLWHYADPDVLQPILVASKAQLQVELTRAREMQEELTRALDAVQPLHLVVTIVITNSGGRPAAIRNMGILNLKLPSRTSSGNDVVAVELTSATPDMVTLVGAGHVEVVKLQSVRSASQLVADHQPFRGETAVDNGVHSSRLKMLFDAGGMRGAVLLARAGVSAADAYAGETEYQPVGAKADEMILMTLRSSSSRRYVLADLF